MRVGRDAAMQFAAFLRFGWCMGGQWAMTWATVAGLKAIFYRFMGNMGNGILIFWFLVLY